MKTPSPESVDSLPNLDPVKEIPWVTLSVSTVFLGFYVWILLNKDFGIYNIIMAWAGIPIMLFCIAISLYEIIAQRRIKKKIIKAERSLNLIGQDLKDTQHFAELKQKNLDAYNRVKKDRS